MTSSRDADVIVLGGGCAGLSLAMHLARTSALRVLVLEARKEYVNDRTWCFWGRLHDPAWPMVAHSWRAWRFSTRHRRATQFGRDGLAYRCVPADRFYERAIDTIGASQSVRLLRGITVERVCDGPDVATVHTSSGSFRSRWVVDTRPPAGPVGDGYRQVFVGREVRTEAAVFDTSAVGLMEDMEVDELGFRFTYVLPFSSRHALVEETRFTDCAVTADDLNDRLDRTLETLGAGGMDIVRVERGSIPMTTALAGDERAGRIVRAGTGGGAVRASTGYAFVRIQRWASACAARLADGADPIGHPPDPAWRATVDRLFLRVIRAQPELAPRAFMAMGEHVPASTLMRFLSDDCRPSDFARVAGVLPKMPFLRELALDLRGG